MWINKCYLPWNYNDTASFCSFHCFPLPLSLDVSIIFYKKYNCCFCFVLYEQDIALFLFCNSFLVKYVNAVIIVVIFNIFLPENVSVLYLKFGTLYLQDIWKFLFIYFFSSHYFSVLYFVYLFFWINNLSILKMILSLNITFPVTLLKLKTSIQTLSNICQTAGPKFKKEIKLFIQ